MNNDNKLCLHDFTKYYEDCRSCRNLYRSYLGHQRNIAEGISYDIDRMLAALDILDHGPQQEPEKTSDEEDDIPF